MCNATSRLTLQHVHVTPLVASIPAVDPLALREPLPDRGQIGVGGYPNCDVDDRLREKANHRG